MGQMLENKTFDEIQVGDSATVSRALREDDIETWAAVTANPNVMTLKEAAPGEGEFLEASGVGMWGASMFSAIIGTQLPGLGSVTQAVEIRFLRPFPVDQQVTATITVTEKRPDTGSLVVDCRCTDAGARREGVPPPKNTVSTSDGASRWKDEISRSSARRLPPPTR